VFEPFVDTDPPEGNLPLAVEPPDWLFLLVFVEPPETLDPDPPDEDPPLFNLDPWLFILLVDTPEDLDPPDENPAFVPPKTLFLLFGDPPDPLIGLLELTDEVPRLDDLLPDPPNGKLLTDPDPPTGLPAKLAPPVDWLPEDPLPVEPPNWVPLGLDTLVGTPPLEDPPEA